MTDKIPSESAEQIAFVTWWRAQRPDNWIFAIPNGGFRHLATAKKLKAEGASPGVPDLYIPSLHLWIEFKRTKGGRLSTDQKDWRDHLKNECGDSWMLAKGAADAVKQVTEFLEKIGA